MSGPSGQAGTPSPHFSPTQIPQIRALDKVHGSNSQESLLKPLEREYGLNKEGRQQLIDTIKYHKDVEAFVGEWNQSVDKVESELHNVASALPNPQELQEIQEAPGLPGDASLAEIDDANIALIEELVAESPHILPKLAERLRIVALPLQAAINAARDHHHRIEHAYSTFHTQSTKLLGERDQVAESRALTFKSEAIALGHMLSNAQAKGVEASQQMVVLEKKAEDAEKEIENERIATFQAKRTSIFRLNQIGEKERALKKANEANADLKKRENAVLKKEEAALKSLSEHIIKHNAIQEDLECQNLNLSKRNSALQDAQNVLEAKLSQMSGEVGGLEKDRKSMQKQLTAREQDVDRLPGEEQSLQTSLDDTTSEISLLKWSKESLLGQLNNKDREVSSLQKEQKALEVKLSKQGKEIDRLADAMNTVLQNLSDKENARAAVAFENADLAAKLAEKEATIARLRSEKNKASRRVSDLGRRFANASSKNVTLSNMLLKRRRQVVRLHHTRSTLLTKDKLQKARMASLDNYCKGHSNAITDLKNTLQGVESANANINAVVADLNSTVEARNTSIVALEQHIQSKDSELETARVAAEQLRSDHRNTRLRLMLASTIRDAINARLESTSSKLATATEQLSLSDQAFAAKETELRAVSDRLKALVGADAKDRIIDQLIDDIRNKLPPEDTTSSDLRQAFAAKQAEFTNAAAMKDMELKDALAAKASEFEGVLAAKASEFEHALAAKDMELKDALAAKASELKDVLAAKGILEKQAVETQAINTGLSLELAEKENAICAVREYGACIPAYRDHILSLSGVSLESSELEALDRSMSTALKFKTMLQVNIPSHPDSTVIHGVAGPSDMVSSAQLVNRLTVLLCQAHQPSVPLKPEDMQLVGQSIFQSQDETVVRQCVSLLFVMLNHVLQAMESSSGFFHRLALLLAIGILSTFVRGDAMAEITRLLSGINPAKVQRSPLLMALAVSCQAKLSGARVEFAAEVIKSARDIGIEVEVGGHSLHRVDGNLVLVAKAEPGGDRKLAIILPEHCHVELCALSAYRPVFTDAPVLGCWFSPFWGFDEFDRIESLAFDQLETRPLDAM